MLKDLPSNLVHQSNLFPENQHYPTFPRLETRPGRMSLELGRCQRSSRLTCQWDSNEAYNTQHPGQVRVTQNTPPAPGLHSCGSSLNKCARLRRRLDPLMPKSVVVPLSCLFLRPGRDHTHAVAKTSAGVVHTVAKAALKQRWGEQKMATVFSAANE